MKQKLLKRQERAKLLRGSSRHSSEGGSRRLACLPCGRQLRLHILLLRRCVCVTYASEAYGIRACASEAYGMVCVCVTAYAFMRQRHTAYAYIEAASVGTKARMQ